MMVFVISCSFYIVHIFLSIYIYLDPAKYNLIEELKIAVVWVIACKTIQTYKVNTLFLSSNKNT